MLKPVRTQILNCPLKRVRSNLPTGQALVDFDFGFQPTIERSRIETFATDTWVCSAESVLMQGPPGVGKAHLVTGLGVKGIE